MKMRQSAGKDFGYILGVYLGDGCVTNQISRNSGKEVKYYPRFKVNTIDSDFAEAIKLALNNMTDRKVTIHKHDVSKSSNPNYALGCGDPELCKLLVEDTQRKMIIPDYVFNWNKSIKLSFIAGLMDSEGFVSKKSNSEKTYYMGFKCCEPWVPDFVKLLESIGIMTGKLSVCQPLKDGYKTPMRFHIKLESWVKQGAYFFIKRKQDKVLSWIAQRSTSTTNTLSTVFDTVKIESKLLCE